MGAKEKIITAVKSCQKVNSAWNNASAALTGCVGVNGYGIFHDISGLRGKLLYALSSIQEALKALDEVDLPTNTEYDEL